MEATQMSIGRWTDKKAVVHINNGILLSYEKEHIWLSSNEVDETGTYYTEYIMRNAGLDEAQAGTKIARQNISNLSYADDELKSLWWKWKRRVKKLA